MANTHKKMAAAIAAVNAYLEMEAAAAAEQAPARPAGMALYQQSHWSQSGRQEMMAMRRLIQLRTFTSLRR